MAFRTLKAHSCRSEGVNTPSITSIEICLQDAVKFDLGGRISLTATVIINISLCRCGREQYYMKHGNDRFFAVIAFQGTLLDVLIHIAASLTTHVQIDRANDSTLPVICFMANRPIFNLL